MFFSKINLRSSSSIDLESYYELAVNGIEIYYVSRLLMRAVFRDSGSLLFEEHVKYDFLFLMIAVQADFATRTSTRFSL
ncbi:MAG: hypothetical protein ACI85H_001439 [Paracoccaceae bacterium]|jgi:hypothetical protein